MNTLRCLLFAAIVVIFSAAFALGGVIQFPGKSDPPPPAPASVSTTESTTAGLTAPTSTEEPRIAWQDLTTERLLLEILLTIY